MLSSVLPKAPITGSLNLVLSSGKYGVVSDLLEIARSRSGDKLNFLAIYVPPTHGIFGAACSFTCSNTILVVYPSFSIDKALSGNWRLSSQTGVDG